ncbi:phosphoribosyl transferase domain protein [Aspergillus fijiensis CBS 313.89]|uniref:Phosphoribosyl transferase domain protein n=1 Tax=Aspergillus fijiensis CBS 313.89 TaxID=1448319 RepID=A0A8G1RG49_9EURO|nr:phosphoribosyl transferase domain protein [Aspergillus fijiensis CBS 313.89]RAK72133.1 phosphoribosyl transferase domain protein [Aspergillus fijiensis CBS 313.89]
MSDLNFNIDNLSRSLIAKASSAGGPSSATEQRAASVTLDTESPTDQYLTTTHLTQLLNPLFDSRDHVSVLEIRPGPKSILHYLSPRLRRKVWRYTAIEPEDSSATILEEWLHSTSKTESPLPCLESPPNIRRISLDMAFPTLTGAMPVAYNSKERFDIIFFSHGTHSVLRFASMQWTLQMLAKRPEGGMVVMIHDGTLPMYVTGLVCHKTASLPARTFRVVNDDAVLDRLDSFNTSSRLSNRWRSFCRSVGRCEREDSDYLLIAMPTIMTVFQKHANSFGELTRLVPMLNKPLKDRVARLNHSSLIVKPRNIQHVQDCVRWALKHGAGLTVIGGGHSGHCIRPHVASVDMIEFDEVHIVPVEAGTEDSKLDAGSVVVAGGGCKTSDIIKKTMIAGLTVPLGSRPSVGAGLWLQGGIGHLARLYGLACDAIVGAVLVSVDSGQILWIGDVPIQHRPAGAVRPENESDLLWAIKGAGTNIGIIVSVTFKAFVAPTCLVRNWAIPLTDRVEARQKLVEFNQFASKLPRNCTADAYLYLDMDQLHLGVTMFEACTTDPTHELPYPMPNCTFLGSEHDIKDVDSVGLFDADMYMTKIHGGHRSGKTYSFKRCLFLKQVGQADVTDILLTAMETRPTPLCYVQLLQGGGAVNDVAADATAFGCRDWDFACMISGVWPREDEVEVAGAVERWVYDVAKDLLPLSSGSYSTDLGPDPRDSALAAKAFGLNRLRLAHIKHSLDPHNVLAYACPLPKAPQHKLVILITGESCAGKDYCARIWASVFTHGSFTVRTVSISDVTKRAYAAATGADLNLLLSDRAYKEQHRPALTEFFRGQARVRPQLPEEHFLGVVYGAVDVDVLLITGMRDQAPVAAFSHLVPDTRLIDVRIEASEETRQARRGCQGRQQERKDKIDCGEGTSNSAALEYPPSLIFENDTPGDEAVREFGEQHLLPLVDENLQRLANMVRKVHDFPRPAIDFRHVLGISQQPGGIGLCTSLLQSHFTGDWAKVGAIACCEAGSFVYGSALAMQVDVPLALIREGGKLPQPTVSVPKSTSHISSMAPRESSCDSSEKRLEIEQGLIPEGASVVVVDDVLATGRTLCAVLDLLVEAGIRAEDVSVMVVAEFPVHRGRELLRQRGFSNVNIRSLLVFDGA